MLITYAPMSSSSMSFALRAVAALALGTLLGCGDGGVVVGDGTPGGGGAPSGDAGGGEGAPATGGTPTGGPAPELVEPEGDGPTGSLPPATSVSSLDPADVEASRFLAQATFGPTLESIAEFRASGDPEAWLDEQMALPMSRTLPYTRANSNGSLSGPRHDAWWNNALDEPDQLRQRVAFALSQIFVVSDLDYALSNAQYGMSDYYDMLASHAFGNYRELLEDVALHPVMGVYLSMVRNEKADPAENVRPDENFAREVLQLFSIGLFELNESGETLPAEAPRAAYTQDTVEEFARVFTGWNYDRVVSWETTNVSGEAHTTPMVPDERFHDTGAKTLLNGTVVPAGLSTREDMTAALDNIFEHPNVGPLLGRQLIQRLVTSNPSPEYVARVSAVFADDGAGTRGNLGAVVRAILLDPEAREGHRTNPDFGKVREPVVRWAHMYRALDAVPGPEANGVHNTADFFLSRIDEMGGQAVMSSPSVFNFYEPDHPIVPGGRLQSPEMQIMSEANLGVTHNNYHHQVYRFTNRSDLSDDNPRVSLIQVEPLVELAADVDDLLDWYNLVLFSGNMPDAMRTLLFDYARALPGDDAGRYARVQDTLFIALVAPAFHLQR